MRLDQSNMRVTRIELKYAAFNWFRRRILHAFNLAIRFGACKMRRLNQALVHTYRAVFIWVSKSSFAFTTLRDWLKVAEHSFRARSCWCDSFSSPETALLLVSTKNRDLWPGPTPEVRDSRTSRHSAHVQSQVWQIWLVLVSIYCVFKAIQKRNVVGPGQRSRFLVLTKRSAASGDENVMRFSARTRIAKTNMPLIKRSFYLLNVRSIFAIFLRNWTQCVNGFSLV